MSEKESTYSRRDFLTRSVTGLASVGILGGAGQVLATSPAEVPANVAGEPSTGKKGEMIYRVLGKTGLRLPVVNMGVMNADNPELVKKAYEMGVRHFDTAAYYQRGRNEEMVGKVIKDLKARDQVVIATKIFMQPQQRETVTAQEARDFFLAGMEKSLMRLQMDYVDILYVHNVDKVEFLNHPGVKEALQIIREKKKARFIGFTTHSHMAECLTDAVKSDFYEVILTVYNYSMETNEVLKEAMIAAAAKNIGLIAMKTQCQQTWYRYYNEPKEAQPYYEGKILHSALLKWVMRHEFFTTAVPGFTTFEQLEEDMKVAYSLDYTGDEKKFLEDRQVKLAMNSVCQQCYACLTTCPRGAQVPELLRTHMYAVSYGNFSEARATLDTITRTKGIEACKTCDSCVARCVRSVPIAGRIQELKEIYG